MKKTMIAAVLGLSLMPLTFAAQTTAKPAADSQTKTSTSSKPAVKKHKKSQSKKPAAKPSANAQTPQK